MSSSIESLINREYPQGFVTEIEADTLPPGLSEDVVRAISAKKNEPPFLLEWPLRLAMASLPLFVVLAIAFGFFKEFSDPLVCYWHDCGHAQIKENLGFIQHAMHLESQA